jgi:hypothetical protein
MIDYKLAKKLKEAGFPNIKPIIAKDISVRLDKFTLKEIGRIVKESIIGYEMPTLLELIEACGKDFWILEQKKSNGFNIYWEAAMIEQISGKGDTPEEAVANLWLKLKADNN